MKPRETASAQRHATGLIDLRVVPPDECAAGKRIYGDYRDHAVAAREAAARGREPGRLRRRGPLDQRPRTRRSSCRTTRPRASRSRACCRRRPRRTTRWSATPSAAFESWRMTPAPKRGELVRDLGNALREMKEPLGDLVSLEMGKIRAEGHGEVQEMIDICDFAVGLSRQLYGLTMASERPGHRMMEQWHPLGVGRRHHRLQLPGRRLVVEQRASPPCAATRSCGSRPSRRRSARSPCSTSPTGSWPTTACAASSRSSIGAGRTVGERDARTIGGCRSSRSPARRRSASTSRRPWRSASAGRSSSSAATTRSSSTEDANLDLAARAILFGAVGTAGQRCTSTRRIIVQQGDRRRARRAAGARLRAGARSAIRSIRRTLMGPLVTPDALTDMFAAHRPGQGRGRRGRRRRRPPRRSRAAVRRADDRPHAGADRDRARRRRSRRSCTCSSTTRSTRRSRCTTTCRRGCRARSSPRACGRPRSSCRRSGSDCGIANVNIGTSGAEIGGAFGGEKETGGGRESGSDAWKAYMRRQTNTVNWSTALPLAQGITFGE